MYYNEHNNLEMVSPMKDAKVSVIADSINPNGERLITFSIRIARFVLAEFNTHRVASRNSASSRAIPVKKQIEKIKTGDHFIPQKVGYNMSGMQAKTLLTENDLKKFQKEWSEAALEAAEKAEEWFNPDNWENNLGIHKQHVNRILEPYIWHEIIFTLSDWNGFIEQRNHKDAQPEIEAAAYCMEKLIDTSNPQKLEWGEWHLPFIKETDRQELPEEELPKVSSARSARVSYLTHMNIRDLNKDLELYNDLINHFPPHASPLEHPAVAFEGFVPGNFEMGWAQLRGFLEPLTDIKIKKYEILNKDWIAAHKIYGETFQQ